MNKYTNRRNFLKYLIGGGAMGVASSPLQAIIESVINRTVMQAHAQTIKFDLERFYLNISFPGAPPRWNYDLFLDPYSANGRNIVANPGVATAFEGSTRHTEAVYKTFKVPGYNINAPHIWGQKMPTSAGTWVPIHNLMEHMLAFQGINTTAPGHDQSRLMMEESNGYSVAGVLADATKSPFSSVDLNSNNPFSSKSGQTATPVVLNTADLISAIMSKFNGNDLAVHNSMDDNIANSYQNVLDNLNYDAGLRTPASVNLKKMHEGAIDLINSTIGSYSTIWQEKFNKYDQLVQSSFTDRAGFLGFMDKPIGLENLNLRDKKYQLSNSANNFAFNPDMRTFAHANMNPTMASIFALAEFLAENKLSSSLQSRINATSAMISVTNGGTISNRAVTHDQHNVGVMVSTLSNALMYRALSSCIYEFINNRKNSSKGYTFNNTVIKLAGDFNRSPRMDGTGSDHGFLGQVTTVFSGKVNAPLIIGRIYKNPPASLVGNAYLGSWGVGAPIDVDGTGAVTLTPGHVTSSVCSLLGIATPAVNNSSLIKVLNGKVELVKPELKLRVV